MTGSPRKGRENAVEGVWILGRLSSSPVVVTEESRFRDLFDPPKAAAKRLVAAERRCLFLTLSESGEQVCSGITLLVELVECRLGASISRRRVRTMMKPLRDCN
jgi:hypothetical protein